MKPSSLCQCVAVIAMLVLGSLSDVRADEATVDYARDIKPVLRERCYACHGALKQEAGLRLDTAAALMRGGDSGPAIVVGKAADSLLINKVTAAATERMPPEGAPLTAEQIERLREWIERGAPHSANETPESDPRDHWAFRVPARAEFSDTDATLSPSIVWRANPVDRFVAAELAEHGLKPVGEAPRSMWLRRVHLDLTGLPPTVDDLQTFADDLGPDAAERVVDRLLASPAHAEHWARHWMDVWRYADWYGRRHVPDWWNSAPQVWRWRDWIVRSLSQDKGYDRMIQEMLAADELAPADDDAAVATGYLARNWYALNQNHWMREIVEHTGKAFLGLTFNCAHCHDHKYDPIEQRDYFRLRAFFEPLHLRQSRERGEADPGPFQEYDYGKLRKVVNIGSIRVFDKFPEKPTHLYMLGDERSRFPGEPTVVAGIPSFLGGGTLKIETIELPVEAFYPNLRPFACEALLAEANAAVAKARSDWDKLSPPSPPHGEGASVSGNVAPAASSADRVVLGRWRFNGSTDDAFLADETNAKRHLERVTGTDPMASSVLLTHGGLGESFGRVPFVRVGAIHPASGPTDVPRAAFFHQDQSFAYLATAPRDDLHAHQWTVEMLVRPTVAAKDFNRTLAELDGSWVWLHRGLDATRSELRLIYWNDRGQQHDVATGGGERPLTITTNHDYYVAVSMSAGEVRFFARDLTDGGTLQTWRAPRDVAGAAVTALRKNSPARFKIGNSDGTGRHCGLIDEVTYFGDALTEAEISARAELSAPLDMAALQASVAREVARTALATAEQARDSLVARIEAERAKYSQPPASDVAAMAERATRAERAWREASADEAVARACQELLAARQTHKSGDAALEKKLTDAQTKVANAYVERAKVVGAPRETSVSYRPVGDVFPRTSTGRRAALARWMTDRSHPLTARVAINHVWKWHFGRPLVDSVFDFGRNGKSPSHPELLDWLAVELMERDWSLKHIHRAIVLSRTYRMHSQSAAPNEAGEVVAAANGAIDPDNHYLWRFPTRRLESESVRDAVLMVAGELDRKIGGPPVDSGDEMASRRRSLYHSVYPEDGGQMKFAKFFDAPDPSECYRRTETVIPQQALVMTNSAMLVRASRDLAARLTRQLSSEANSAPDDDAFVRTAYRTIVARDPSSAERELCARFLADQKSLYAAAASGVAGSGVAASGAAASGAAAPADKAIPAAAADPVQRARESLVRSLLNHNDFLTIR